MTRSSPTFIYLVIYKFAAPIQVAMLSNTNVN
jgi:hypothetical protein